MRTVQEHMLVVDNVHKAYQKEPVLNGVSFTCSPSQIVGICGSNGAGKTTLIHILASILPADQGSVSLCQIPITQPVQYRSMIGFVPQQVALSPQLTVRQNLHFWAAIKGFTGTKRREAVDSAAEMSHVTSFLQKKVARCSGGMARRVNLAAGLIGLPRLLLLDEPTAGIDEENRDAILKTILSLKDHNCTVLMVNHYYQELASVCDRIITLKDGVIAEAGVHGW
ncbi:MAG: ABC transporter ATP-binding protein [Clostridiaceae bacterium]|nr:ABC transporter ATP-binding protein [Eubacteriales bacterium]NLV47938.1 ABC transporter ATP-binding protein [Clostridiaceae bacterium]